ncbi:MAG TPA: HesA/MoeB/ThiF family protein [Syntrophobacteraceae bacterium]|nr:HesA/MoeB/ThiF family protein [Syntrophobacteraceae bacterium]
MNIQELAEPRNDLSGGPPWGIDDDSLLEYARRTGSTPGQAQREALDNGILPLRYEKNLASLDFREQVLLSKSRVLICGCGGLGGVLIHLLARAGVGFMRLVDGDVFAVSNFNRQWFCETGQIGRPKAPATRSRLSAINPFVEVEAFQAHLDEGNGSGFLAGMDLALDALDNLPGRFILGEAACRAGIPYIHAAVAGWWGQISTFPPGFPGDLGLIYGRTRDRNAREESLGVLGPAVSCIASLQSMEALRLLAGRSPAYAGKLLYLDGETGHVEIVPLRGPTAR